MNDDITHGLTSPFKCSPSSELIFTKIYLQKIKTKAMLFVFENSSLLEPMLSLFCIL